MLQYPHLPPSSDFQDQLRQIEVLAQALAHIPISLAQKQTVFHRQLLRSSLFSARIEGNRLSLNQLENIESSSSERNKLEVANVMRALQSIPSLKRDFSLDSLKQIHQAIMRGLSADAGKFRAESTAIYDQHGNLIYITPGPDEMKIMLDTVIGQINLAVPKPLPEQLISILASHYYLEKIHPFVDGNGRTGRAVIQYQLRQVPLLSDHILPLDQFFDDHRSQYYYHLEKNSRQISEFVGFFLEGLSWSLERYLQDIKNVDGFPDEDQSALHRLLPRRQEIVRIIADHPYIPFDSIARRFPTLPRRTVANDVAQLVKLKLITKHGQTRGVVYSTEL